LWTLFYSSLFFHYHRLISPQLDEQNFKLEIQSVYNYMPDMESPLPKPAASSRRNAGAQKYRQYQRTKKSNASVSSIKPEESQPQNVAHSNPVRDAGVISQQRSTARLKATSRSNSNISADNNSNQRHPDQSLENHLVSATEKKLEAKKRSRSPLPVDSSIKGIQRKVLPNKKKPSSTHSSAKVKSSAPMTSTKRSPLQKMDMNSPQRKKRPVKASKTSNNPQLQNATKSAAVSLQPSAFTPAWPSNEVEELPTKIRSSSKDKKTTPMVAQQSSSDAAKAPVPIAKQSLSKILSKAEAPVPITTQSLSKISSNEDEHEKLLNELSKFVQLDYDDVRSYSKILYALMSSVILF